MYETRMPRKARQQLGQPVPAPARPLTRSAPLRPSPKSWPKCIDRLEAARFSDVHKPPPGKRPVPQERVEIDLCDSTDPVCGDELRLRNYAALLDETSNGGGTRRNACMNEAPALVIYSGVKIIRRRKRGAA